MTWPDILLVENDAADVAVARRALRRAGIDGLRVARDGEEALANLQIDGAASSKGDESELPDVIFLDLRIPKLDGFEVLREIRSHPLTSDLPVVVVSSSSRDEDVRAAYRLGANSFLVKRYESRQPGAFLAEAARYWLELNRAPRPQRR